MPTFEAWDVVAVPFPYTDKATRQRRPALVIGAGASLDEHGLLWVLMITSAENRPWSGDVPIDDLTLAGLPAASVVRTAKIATIETKEAEKRGTVSTGVRQSVKAVMRGLLPG